MTTLQQAEQHKVFPVERRGDTLVVTPKGDLVGFSGTDIHLETDRLIELIEESETTVVIVDFGRSNYFGSEMIGAINNLAIKTREAEKRFAVCDVSQDMLEGLKIMKVDTLWSLYDTRKEALAALTIETFSQQYESKLNWVIGAAIVLVLAMMVWLFAFQPFRNVDQHYYDSYMEIYQQLQQTRIGPPSRAKWNTFSRPARRQLEEILKDLEETAGPDEPAKQYLLSAGHVLLELLQDARGQSPHTEQLFEKQMAEAKKWIDEAADAKPMPEKATGKASPPSESSQESQENEQENEDGEK